MFDNSASVFRCVAMGTAAENKKLGSKKLLVTPHEKLPFMDGEIVERVDTIEYEGVDDTGQVKGGNAFVSNEIEANWLPDTNRRTAPDIQRGERITLWQYANNDKYYWRSMGLDDDLRRLETVVVGINANPDMGEDGVDPDNMYFIEISSHNKSITLSTSQKNSELVTYDFQFDLAKGRVVLQDNIGNHSLFDSINFNIEWQNRLGTYLKLNKQEIIGYAPANIKMTAGANIDMKANKITLDGGGSVFTLEASGTSLVTPSFSGKSGGGG